MLDATKVHTRDGLISLNQAFTHHVLTHRVFSHGLAGEQVYLAHALVVLAGFWLVAAIMHALRWHVSV
jgi:hypothetical protein